MRRAAHYWERVLELEPNHEDARQRLADLYLDQAEEARQWGYFHLGQLIDTYEKALEYRPEDGRIEAQIAQTYLMTGNPDEAQAYIERALEHNPADEQVYQDLIIGWFAAEEPDEAWALMERAEANVPDLSPLFYINLASNRLYNDEEEIARPWLERAIEKAPPEMPIYIVIGEMALSMPAGGEELGIEYLQRAVEQNQMPGQAYLIMGILAIKMGDEEEAKRYWRKGERIARRSRDGELQERIEEARSIFTGPLGILGNRLRGGLPFAPDLFDFDDEFDDEFDDFYEDDDDFYF